MKKDQFEGIVRTVLAAGGGYFVGKGLIDNQTMMAVSGALATLATAGWSYWSKK